MYVIYIFFNKRKIGQRPAHEAGTATHWFIFHTDTGLAQSHLLTGSYHFCFLCQMQWLRVRPIVVGRSEQRCQGHLSVPVLPWPAWSNLLRKLGFWESLFMGITPSVCFWGKGEEDGRIPMNMLSQNPNKFDHAPKRFRSLQSSTKNPVTLSDTNPFVKV